MSQSENLPLSCCGLCENKGREQKKSLRQATTTHVSIIKKEVNLTKCEGTSLPPPFLVQAPPAQSLVSAAGVCGVASMCRMFHPPPEVHWAGEGKGPPPK